MAALDWDGKALLLTKLEKLATPKDVLQWVNSEAADNSGIGIWKRTPGLSIQLVKLGINHGDELESKTPARFQIEVDPPAAARNLFALKARSTAALRAAMLDHLPRLSPRLQIADLPATNLNAVLAAYLAAYWWCWGRDRHDVSGHLVVPRRPAPEWRLADLREEYLGAPLDESHLDADPIRQFQTWYDQARAVGIAEANAMTLATVLGRRPTIRQDAASKGHNRRWLRFFHELSEP